MKNSKTKNFIKYFLVILVVTYTILSSLNRYPTPKDIVAFQYNIPKLNLDIFSEDRKDILLDYLTKSSKWHVFPLSGRIVAARRSDSKTCNLAYKTSSDSKFAGMISYPQISLFGSAVDAPDSMWYYPVQISKANDNSRVELSLEKVFDSSGSKNSFGSKLIIESKNKKLTVTADEISKDTPRVNTTKFLNATKEQLDKLANIPSTENKVDESLLPAGSIVLSDHPIISIQNEGDFESGVYKVSGYINEGEKGLITLKVIDKNHDRIISRAYFTESEYVGWSTNPMQKFNFCLQVKLWARFGNPERAESEFQIWFKPADNSPERTIYWQTKTVKLLLY